jgi:hypothetical protein
VRELARSVNIPILPVNWYESGGYHAASLFGWGPSDPRSLDHTDLLILAAETIGPWCAFNKWGPLGDAAAASLAFRALWRLSSELSASWYFEYLPYLPPRAPVDGTSAPWPPSDWDSPDQPRVVGYFRTPPHGDRAPSTLVGKIDYELCSWNPLLEIYCEEDGDATRFATRWNSLVYSPNTPEDFPQGKTTSEMFTRAGQCVAANGGCEAMIEDYRAFRATEGSNVWE